MRPQHSIVFTALWKIPGLRLISSAAHFRRSHHQPASARQSRISNQRAENLSTQNPDRAGGATVLAARRRPGPPSPQPGRQRTDRHRSIRTNTPAGTTLSPNCPSLLLYKNFDMRERTAANAWALTWAGRGCKLSWSPGWGAIVKPNRVS